MLKKRIKDFENKANWLKKGVIYHRGKHGNGVIENTMEAFDLAVKDGLGIELDVRLTKDNKVIVFHDKSLKRIFNIDKCVESTLYEELLEHSNGKIPLLEDVLELVNDRVGVMVEIKSSKGTRLEKEVIEILNNYKGRYVIVSFNPLTLRYFRKKAPSIIRGQLACSFKNNKYSKLKKLVLGKMLLNVFSKPHFISYGIEDCNYKLLDKYRKKGYFIVGWTYNNVKNELKLKEVYDNMIVESIDIKEF